MGRIVIDSNFVKKGKIMIQAPCVPQFNPMVQPQQPNYNAVKIDIHNPQVGQPTVPCAQPQYPQPQYAQPTAPIYNYPQANVYGPQAVPQQFPCCYPPAVMPQPGVVPAQNPGQPSVINQQNVNMPPAQPQEVPAPQVSEPEVVKPEDVKPQVDLNEFISKLMNPDFNEQVSGMEKIAGMIKESPEKATELVDTKVFDALNGIINFDSSKLEGPSQAQIDARQKILEGKEVTEAEKNLANTMTQKELAERNKSYALFTVAMLDKLYADEVAKLSNTVVPLTELPEAVNIVNQLKDNPNPMVRASAIQALSYVQNPEYKKDLTTLFTVAKNDQDPGVAQEANAALEKLAQI